jgi:putative tryptophan/tyrosine transport system substrate-binding protein
MALHGKCGRKAPARTEQLSRLARELIALAPNAVYAGEPSAARAIKKAAPDLPIVCPVLTDRLRDLFASYARPGGSVTGIASTIEDMNGKQVELALDVVPGADAHRSSYQSDRREPGLYDSASRSRYARPRQLLVEQARTPDELAPAFDRLTKGRAEAVIVAPNGMFINQRRSIVQLALAAGMPTIFQDRQDVEAGGLASYGVEQRENHRRSALFVDKILKGAKPGDLPIEFPTKLLLVVNLKTARALGIAIPPTVLGRADEVIE